MTTPHSTTANRTMTTPLSTTSISLNTPLTPPPPYCQMNGMMSEANKISGPSPYCCFGTVHVKSALFMLCASYLFGLGCAWYELLPTLPPFGDHLETVKAMRLEGPIFLLVCAAVVICAIIGINCENQLFFLPLIVAQIGGVIFSIAMVFLSSFGSPNSDLAFMCFIFWLSVTAGLIWTTHIVIACFRLFCYHRFYRATHSSNNNGSPALTYNTNSPMPIMRLNDLTEPGDK